MLDALIGNVDHQVALIGFDSTPHLVVPFTPDTDNASRGLATLSEGDNGAAILDAIGFAVEQLRTQPPKYRRVILLLSETVDQGSKTTLNDALRLVSDTNTTIYSLAFSSTRSAVSHEASKLATARIRVPRTAASARRAPTPSTKVTTTSRCSTASVSLLRPFVWSP